MASAETIRDRAKGALFAMFVADSLAMPVHWFYRPGSIEEVYGEPITGYVAPKKFNPDAFACSMTFDPAPDSGVDILFDDKQHVKPPGTSVPPEERLHYHFRLEAGGSTLGMQLERELLRCTTKHGYNPEAWLEAFRDFLTTPGKHTDFYRDVFIRRFFERLSHGMALGECAVPQREVWSVGSMGGLLPVIPVAILLRSDPGLVDKCVRQHRATHNSENVETAARVLVPLLKALLERPDGSPVDAARDLIVEHARQLHLPVTRGPELLAKYNEARGPSNIPKEEMYKLHTTLDTSKPFDPREHLDKDDDHVIGRKGFLSTACYTEHAFPGILYLATKYTGDLEAGLLKNVNLLGDSTSRGSVLGSVLGAVVGFSGIPEHLVKGLKDSAAIEAEIDALLDKAFAD